MKMLDKVISYSFKNQSAKNSKYPVHAYYSYKSNDNKIKFDIRLGFDILNSEMAYGYYDLKHKKFHINVIYIMNQNMSKGYPDYIEDNPSAKKAYRENGKKLVKSGCQTIVKQLKLNQ